MKITYAQYQERSKFIYNLLDLYLDKSHFTVLPKKDMEETALLHLRIREPFKDAIANFFIRTFQCSVTFDQDMLGQKTDLIVSLDSACLEITDEEALSHFKMALELEMPKYLMFDHGGVLEGEVVQDLSSIQEDDLILEELDWGGALILRQGVLVVHHINELVDHFNYQVVFHSKNDQQVQLELLNKLQISCSKKGLNFPRVHAMAVFDKLSLRQSDSPETCLLRPNDTIVATWGVDDKDGKASVRRALEAALRYADEQSGKQREDRKEHIVFDDGEPNVTIPLHEGYQGYLIGSGEGRMSLEAALSQVILNATRKADLVKTTKPQERPKTPAAEESIEPATLSSPTSSEASFFNPLLQPSPSISPSNNLSASQLNEIVNAMTILNKEIYSCWPYPNKDVKILKYNALSLLITLCETMEVLAAVKEVERLFPRVRSGRFSTRTADLLEKLKTSDHDSNNTHKVP